MSRDRYRRGLTDEDKRLWSRVRETAEPLRPEPEDVPPSPPARPPEPHPPASRPRTEAPRLPAYRPPVSRPSSSPSGTLDRRTVNRLTRGRLPVDARIDLHGLTQTPAHRQLFHFLKDAQARGARTVLVITGKGQPGEPTAYGVHERGILRRVVPEWLRSADFRPLVSGYSEAGRRHGGAGAIYVRLRRIRD